MKFRFGIALALALLSGFEARGQNIPSLPPAVLPLVGTELFILSQPNSGSPTGFSSRNVTFNNIAAAINPTIAPIANNTVLGNVSGISGIPTPLVSSQLSPLVTMSLISGALNLTQIQNINPNTVLGNVSVGSAPVAQLTPSQLSALVPLTIGTTSITGGTTTRVLFDNAGVIGERVVSGNGTTVATTTGTLTSGHCVSIDASGNLVDNGSTCGGNIAIGSTVVTGGTNGRILFDNSGVAGERTPSGNGTTVATTAGTLTNTHCVSIDASGNLVDNGAACGSGGGTVDSQLFTTPGVTTWNRPVGVTLVEVTVCGAGGGGGSGAQCVSGTNCSGGAGGGPGMCRIRQFRASDVGASASIIVATGGPGGPTVSTTNTPGTGGTDGGNSFFSMNSNTTIVEGFGGGAGQGGRLAASSAGGGSAGNGGPAAGTTGGAIGGASGVGGGSLGVSFFMIGGSGGGGSNVTTATGQAGANAGVAPGSGGAGGGVTAAPAGGPGGAGGQTQVGLGCAASTAGAVGANGSVDTANFATDPGCGGGGGGGQIGNTGAPGNGANASGSGGGGGGGGSVCTSGGACTAQNSGTGGNGGNGLVWVRSW